MRKGSSGSVWTSRKRKRRTWVPRTATPLISASQGKARTASSVRGARQVEETRNSGGAPGGSEGPGSATASGGPETWPRSGAPLSGRGAPPSRTAARGTVNTPLWRSQANRRTPTSSGSAQRAARPPVSGARRSRTAIARAPAGTVERQARTAGSAETARTRPSGPESPPPAVTTPGTPSAAAARPSVRPSQARAARCTILGVQRSRTAAGSSQTSVTAPGRIPPAASNPQARARREPRQAGGTPLPSRIPPFQCSARPWARAAVAVRAGSPGGAAALRSRSRDITSGSEWVQPTTPSSVRRCSTRSSQSGGGRAASAARSRSRVSRTAPA